MVCSWFRNRLARGGLENRLYTRLAASVTLMNRYGGSEDSGCGDGLRGLVCGEPLLMNGHHADYDCWIE